ncbi:MAG: hypothetical protein VW810_00555 [Pelagibacteraceae bacterium]
MSEEQKQPNTDQVSVEQTQTTQTTESTEVPKAKEMTFSQEQLDRIIQDRISAEKRKHERVVEEQKKAEAEALKQKEIAEAKTKADLERLMQERIAEKDKEIQSYKNMMAVEKIDNSILSAAGEFKAVNPHQVATLLKSEIKLSDDNRVEIIDNNGNIRYNPKGELLKVQERVKEFLDANPHFRQGSLSGAGSQSSVEGKSVKPFNIAELDMNNPEDRKKYAEYKSKRDAGAIKINLNN